MNLQNGDMQVRLADVKALAATNSDANQFVRWALQYGLSRGKQLQLLVDGLLQTGRVSSVQESLAYLAGLTVGIDYGAIQPNGTNFDGGVNGTVFNRIKEALGKKKPNNAWQLYRVHGVKGHRVILEGLYQQIVPGLLAPTKNPRYKPLAVEKELPLFDANRSIQSKLFDWEPDRILLKSYRPTDQHLQRIEECAREAQFTLQGTTNWYERYDKAIHFLYELVQLLAPIFGYHIKELLSYHVEYGPWSDYVTLLTLIEWAEMLVHIHGLEELPISWAEVPVVSEATGAGERGADLISISSVDGRPPTPDEKRLLRRLSSYYRPPTIPQLFAFLSGPDGLRKRVVGACEDLKLGGGDFHWEKMGDSLVYPMHCPVKDHQDQVQLYMLLAAMGAQRLNGHTGEDTWNGANLILEAGKLQYCLPTNPLLMFPVTADPALPFSF